MKISQKRMAFVFIILLTLAFTTGCDLFNGSSGDSTPVPTNNHNPNSSNSTTRKDANGPGKKLYITASSALNTLKQTNEIYTFENTENKAENIILEVPVEKNKEVKYALIVKNISNNSQDIALFPEANNKRVETKASLRESSHTNYNNFKRDLNNARWGDLEAQRIIKENLYKSFKNSKKNLANKRLAIKKSNIINHSNEKVNEQFVFNILNRFDNWANPYDMTHYSPCEVTLKKITKHTKLFVDNDCLKGDQHHISDEYLEHFAEEIENIIWNFMDQNYSAIIDVDNDGKFSIVFSKRYAKIGLAGLFNSVDFTGENGNNRDMVGIWAPGSDSKWQGEYWLAATRETIAHEMQHAANFSAKDMSSMEEIWLDESLSVGAEARYRLLRAQANKATISGYTQASETDSVANDNRFGSWIENSNISMNDWYGNYAHYGQKGLFNFYLYEQLGDSFIRELHKSPYSGIQSINYALGTTGDTRDYNRLIKDWEIAILNEALHSKGIIDKNRITKPEHKYINNMLPSFSAFKESSSYTLSKNYKLGEASYNYEIPKGATLYFTITQPRNFTGNNGKFIVAGSGYELNIRMYRLTAD